MHLFDNSQNVPFVLTDLTNFKIHNELIHSFPVDRFVDFQIVLSVVKEFVNLLIELYDVVKDLCKASNRKKCRISN